ncbi:uncharacterized protein LOC122005369 [Zingiber officinale]|uniref:Uncharacterized protein n=1 Tax=Zingiber officinale TaxID=94328 RepID=A0A8J5FQT1_ZINOF|nr:uncharacterized protein LOC122005369 [Zingiber officinale]KAG6488990.1 hypothetical protein ZIOFF_050248 [Zingiber officinale]
MADRSAAAAAAAKPIWIKQAEEAKIKSEAEKTAAAKAAFDATFKALEKAKDKEESERESSDSDADDPEDLATKPIGPVDPSKCIAAGPGIAGGTACASCTFTVVTKDSDSRKVPIGGAQLNVKISPGVGVGSSDQEGMVKDQGDGSYAVTYAVPKRGNYMVHVDCNGKPIMGSPFPVFFSAGTTIGTASLPAVSPYPNMVNQSMPNMPNYAGSVSGAFSGLLGMTAGVSSGSSAGVVLQGIGASLGEICREYLNGQCSKTECKLNHPPHNLLMTALSAASTMGTLSQAPMAPSAAAMAAAQAIVAARILGAHAAQMQTQSSGLTPGSRDETTKADALKKTIQVSNLSPLLTADLLKHLFGYCGSVVDCTITESKHFAYIEYSKAEEATAALALNNVLVGERPLNVEMANSLPSKSSLVNSSLSSVMQQAVAMQQMQFRQALKMQQEMTTQQAAARVATMKSATEMASARAAEISMKLKADGLVTDAPEVMKSRSPSIHRQSKSRSRSPIKYRRSRYSFSPLARYHRERRSRSPIRSRHSRQNERTYRDGRDLYSRRRERERSRDHYSSSRRNRSRSSSPVERKSSRAEHRSLKHHREGTSSRAKRSSRAGSRSPRFQKSNGSPVQQHSSSHRNRHSRSRSMERRHHSDKKDAKRKTEKMKQDDRTLDKGNEPFIDGKRTRDSKEDKVAIYSAAKRRSLSPEDDLPSKERGTNKHKRSRLNDIHSEKAGTMNSDEGIAGEDLDAIRDKRSAHFSNSKQHGRMESDVNNKQSENQDSSKSISSCHKKHDKINFAIMEKETLTIDSTYSRDDKKSSYHLSSSSYKSARCADEFLKSEADQNKVEMHEEPLSRKSQISDDIQKMTDNLSGTEPYNSNALSIEERFPKDSTGDRNYLDSTSSGMNEDYSVNNVTFKVIVVNKDPDDDTKIKERKHLVPKFETYSIKNENAVEDPVDANNAGQMQKTDLCFKYHQNFDHRSVHNGGDVSPTRADFTARKNDCAISFPDEPKKDGSSLKSDYHNISHGLLGVEETNLVNSRIINCTTDEEDLANIEDTSITVDNSAARIPKKGFGGYSTISKGVYCAQQNSVADSSVSDRISADKVSDLSNEIWKIKDSTTVDSPAHSSSP